MDRKKIYLYTIIESIYIYFMYNLFKTSISFHSPLEILIQKNVSTYLQHPISTGIYESKICQFGKNISVLIIIWLWLRLFLDKNNYLNKLIFILIFICSFIMNINSFIYFIPIFIYEFFIFPKIIQNKD